MNNVSEYLREIGLSPLSSDGYRALGIFLQNHCPNFVMDRRFYESVYRDSLPGIDMEVWKAFDCANWDYKNKLLTALLSWAQKSFRNTPGVVVDIGCGSATDTCWLARHFPEKTFVGIDCSPGSIPIATARAARLGLGNVKFVLGEALRMDPELADKKCDAFVMNNILDDDDIGMDASKIATTLKNIGNVSSPATKLWVSLTPAKLPKQQVRRILVNASREAGLAPNELRGFNYGPDHHTREHLCWELAVAQKRWWQIWRE